MKPSMLKPSTTLTICIAILLICNGSFAQTPWYLGGQNTAGEAIGTINLQPFTIMTNSTPRYYFTTAGSFGLDAATPNYKFQTHQSTASTANYMQVSNNTTGSGSTDGLLVGLDATGRTVLNQQENRHINLFTNSIHRIKLNPSISYDVNGYRPWMRHT